MWRSALVGLLAAMLAGCTLSDLFPVANQHGRGFADTHGALVKAAGGPTRAKIEKGMTCDQCHSVARNAQGQVPDSRGSRLTCYSCHRNGPAGMPHASTWKHGTHVVQAGGYKLAKVNGQLCSTCHTADKAADGTIPASPAAESTCFTCHASGPNGRPHAADWRKTHGDAVERGGGYLQLLVRGQHCSDCHTVARAADGTVPASPAAVATCFTCHDGPQGED